MATTPASLDDAFSAKSLAESIASTVGGPAQPYGESSFMVRCPSHADKNPSLSVSFSDGKPLVHCHAGCTQSAVISALKLKGLWPKSSQPQHSLSQTHTQVHPSDVFSDRETPPSWIYARIKNGSSKHSSYSKYSGHWMYRSADGEIIGAVARYDGQGVSKSFLPFFKKLPNGGFAPGHISGQPHVLYQLDRLTTESDVDVWVPEGEQAAAALSDLGALATTSCNGSKSPQKTDWSPLASRHVIIWPDADSPGMAYAQQVAALCYAAGAASVRFVDLRAFSVFHEIDTGWDAADWVRSGGCDLNSVPLMDSFKAFDPAKQHPSQSVPITMPTKAPNPPAPKTTSGTQNAQQKLFRRSRIYTEVTAPDVDKKGNLLPTLATALYEIQQLFPTLCMNDFTNKIFYDNDYEFQEFDTDEVCLSITARDNIVIPQQLVYRAINIHANRNSFHPVLNYLEGLVWDGEPRIDHWLPDIFGCPTTDYTMQAGKNFLIGAAARILKPGIKMDYMLVLYGKQGRGKSTACEVLVGDKSWFTPTIADPSSKDFYQILTGHWIVELSELDSFKNGRDSAIKSAISTSTDTYRPPYGRVTASFPRQCVFIGTTDKPEFLRDTAGNRRFWPITVSEIRLDLLAQNRDQYWAEAVHRFRAGETFHEMPDSTFEEQEFHRSVDPWEMVISQYLQGEAPREYYPPNSSVPPESVTTLELLKHALGLPFDKMDRRSESRVGSVLRALGWEPSRIRLSAEEMAARGLKTARERRYFPPKPGA